MGAREAGRDHAARGSGRVRQREVALALLLALPGAASGQEPADTAPVTTRDPIAPAPREAEPLGLEEAAALGVGAPVDLAALGLDPGDHDALVVVLTSLRCPIARLYAPSLADLAARHPRARVVVVGVAARDTLDELRAAAAKHGWPEVVHDAALLRVGALRPRRTTECFVIDRAGVLRYRGAIDDQYGQGYRRAAPRRRFLEDALRAVLRGEPVPVPATTAPGCVIQG